MILQRSQRGFTEVRYFMVLDLTGMAASQTQPNNRPKAATC
jgi:hypothetical protein